MELNKLRFKVALRGVHERTAELTGSNLSEEKQRRALYDFLADVSTNQQPGILPEELQEIGDDYVARGLEAIRN